MNTQKKVSVVPRSPFLLCQSCHLEVQQPSRKYPMNHRHPMKTKSHHNCHLASKGGTATAMTMTTHHIKKLLRFLRLTNATCDCARCRPQIRRVFRKGTMVYLRLRNHPERH